jgi:hypothetical protein
MSFENAEPPMAPATIAWGRRHKPLHRRVAHDLRVLGPLVAIVVQALVVAAAILAIEGLFGSPDRGEGAYWPTTSISSTSNVSAAPPGMPPGDPRSP